MTPSLFDADSDEDMPTAGFITNGRGETVAIVGGREIVLGPAFEVTHRMLVYVLESDQGADALIHAMRSARTPTSNVPPSPTGGRTLG